MRQKKRFYSVMPESLWLYSYFRSSCSYRVRIALYLKEIPFIYKPVHLTKEGGGQFQESFKQINPFKQVPCLKQGDMYLSQSLPIILYLEKKWPNPPLLPKEPFKQAEVLSVCEMINSSIQPLQNLQVLKAVEQKWKGDKLEWAKFWIERGFSDLEEFLKSRAGTFSFGNSLTMADLFVVPQVYNADRFKVSLKNFPLLSCINKECLKLEAFQKAHPANQPDSE